MFKKDPHIKALSNLKNSERKKLLASVREQREVSDYQFPTQVVKQTTFKGQTSAGTVYTDEQNVPIWFKEKHGSLMFPTVFTCWSNPDILPVVQTHEHVVEEKLLKGADLMLPGMVPPFSSKCSKGSLVGVVSTRSPRVIKAIGIVQLDLPSYTRVIGETGVAVNIIHTFDDGLCKAFKMKLEPPEVIEDTSSKTEEREEEHVDSADEGKAIAATTQARMVNTEDVSEQLNELSAEDIDHFLTRSLYYTLTQDDRLQLPINASNFVSNHILHNLPPVDHNQVNMKKSSWKKSAKFLKHFEKANFLKLKGKGDDLVVVGINKDKDELKKFVPYRIGGHGEPTQTKAKAQENSNMMQAVSLYKPISSVKEFSKAVDLPPNKIFTAQELKAALDSYILEKNLVKKDDKKMVLLDDTLFPMINRSTKKENALRTISRAQIMPPFLANNFTEHFQILKGDVPLFKTALKGAIPEIHIVTEMKIGRKVVTKVSNFEKFQLDAETLAAELRKRCSGSTTIGETMSSPKTLEVTVQGPHGAIVIGMLNEYGIPTKWINFQNKLKNKKKRKPT